jgi:hypothetical protein
MKSKVLEHSSKRLAIQFTYKDERIQESIYAIAGILIIIFTYLGVIPSIFTPIGKGKDDLSILFYVVGIGTLFYGLFGLYKSFTVNNCVIEKLINKVKIEKKSLGHSSSNEYPLSEVTGVEELPTSKSVSGSELVLWLKREEQIRGEKIQIAKASGILQFHLLWRKISEFLAKDQSILILDRQWTIAQNEDFFKIYSDFDMYRNSDSRAYSVDKKLGFLTYEFDRREIGSYKVSEIKDIETEINPDKSDEESSDRITLIMHDGGKIPISEYQYEGHAVVVRALKYAIGLQAWLHISPTIE